MCSSRTWLYKSGLPWHTIQADLYLWLFSSILNYSNEISSPDFVCSLSFVPWFQEEPRNCTYPANLLCLIVEISSGVILQLRSFKYQANNLRSVVRVSQSLGSLQICCSSWDLDRCRFPVPSGRCCWHRIWISLAFFWIVVSSLTVKSSLFVEGSRTTDRLCVSLLLTFDFGDWLVAEGFDV